MPWKNSWGEYAHTGLVAIQFWVNPFNTHSRGRHFFCGRGLFSSQARAPESAGLKSFILPPGFSFPSSEQRRSPGCPRRPIDLLQYVRISKTGSTPMNDVCIRRKTGNSVQNMRTIPGGSIHNLFRPNLHDPSMPPLGKSRSGGDSRPGFFWQGSGLSRFSLGISVTTTVNWRLWIHWIL